MSGEALDILHLAGVDRESAGTYACSAMNTEGETRSSHLTLRVQCKSNFCLVFFAFQGYLNVR